VANRGLCEPGATADVEQYMVIPGNARRYKVGQLGIQELCARYQKQLGGKFSLSIFHDKMLKDDGLPLLVVLEHKMDDRATRQR